MKMAKMVPISQFVSEGVTLEDIFSAPTSMYRDFFFVYHISLIIYILY